MSTDAQPTLRTRQEMLEGMHLLSTHFKPHGEVAAATQQIQTAAIIDGHETKSEFKNVE